MLRVLGKISIYGTKESLEMLNLCAPIHNGTISKVGANNNILGDDFWHYSSPWYRFHWDNLDEEIHNFLTTYENLGEKLALKELKIRHAYFTLCPVGQTFEETFSYLFTFETLKAFIRAGLAFEMAPASIMPPANYWSE